MEIFRLAGTSGIILFVETVFRAFSAFCSVVSVECCMRLKSQIIPWELSAEVERRNVLLSERMLSVDRNWSARFNAV